jgi:hypothetical protein
VAPFWQEPDEDGYERGLESDSELR